MLKQTILSLCLALFVLPLQAQSRSASNEIPASKPTAELKHGLVDSPLPSFSGKDLAGNKIASDDLKGKVVVVNLWFTKCAPCIREMPALNKIKADYESQDVVFLAMAPEDNATLKRFLRKHQFDFSILPNSMFYIASISNVMPVNMVIDKNGIVRKFTGAVPIRITTNELGEKTETFDSSEIRASIDTLLKE